MGSVAPGAGAPAARIDDARVGSPPSEEVLAVAVPAADQVHVHAQPREPLLEATAFGQALNFDFQVANTSLEPIELRAIAARVKDEAGAVLAVIEVNDNGVAPGIGVVPRRTIAPSETATLFNPLHTFASGLEIASIDYTLTFTAGERELSVPLTIEPHAYQQKVRLVFPLAGEALIWDGHDFLSHHRRLDFDHAVVRQLGLTSNSGRYSLDIVLVDRAGELRRAGSDRPEDNLSYRQPVLAPGDGVVVAATGDVDEAHVTSLEELERNPMALFGNYIVIDHGNGEFSRLGHLFPGSLRVAIGQRVHAGDVVAQVGNSGSSLFPHLHYELGRTADLFGEGLPAVFSDLDRVLGGRRERLLGRGPDSGEIVAKR